MGFSEPLGRHPENNNGTPGTPKKNCRVVFWEGELFRSPNLPPFFISCGCAAEDAPRLGGSQFSVGCIQGSPGPHCAAFLRWSELLGSKSHIIWGFLKMGDAQVTMGFNTKSWSFMTWRMWGAPIVGDLHMSTWISLTSWTPSTCHRIMILGS